MLTQRALPLAAAIAFSLLPLCAAADGVRVRFDASDPAASPFPSDRFTVRDWSNNTFRRVKLPKPDCAVRVSDCEDIDVINTLDGFSTQPRITVPFTGDIDPASVNSNTVFLINLGDTLSLHGFGQKVGINQVVWDTATKTLAFESDELLNQHSRYVLLVTDGVRDTKGERIKAGGFDHGEAGSHDGSEYRRDLRDAARMNHGGHDKVVAATLFTTQSISADLVKIMRRIKQSTPVRADFVVGNPGPAAVRAVFPVGSLSAIQFVRQTGTAPTFAPPAALPLAVLGAVGQVAYGKFRSPDYETVAKYIPATGTLSGHPQVQGTNELTFQLFVPAGAKPAAGWPVAVFGHGGGSSIYGGTWRVAAELASQGIAMVAINAVGHGGGPLGTLSVLRPGQPPVLVDAGGRGIDQDGNGSIDGSEGSRAAPPRSAIGNRDGMRQTVVDNMQLVRQIEVGIDIDGDGQHDLNAGRIYFVGQSFGGNWGAMLLGVEPYIQAGAVNVAAGSALESLRLGSARFVLGFVLAARVPSLINIGGPSGFEFNDNVPLRNLPPVTNMLPGAMAIAEMFDRQEWVQQAANPVAYAPFIAKQPLHGNAAKPVIFQFAKGDQTAPNPTNSAILRAGDLAHRATYFRYDLAFALNPTLPKDPHAFLTSSAVPALQGYALAAQRQIATFFATNGVQTMDPDGAGPLFEVPIPLPLPETLSFIP